MTISDKWRVSNKLDYKLRMKIHGWLAHDKSLIRLLSTPPPFKLLEANNHCCVCLTIQGCRTFLTVSCIWICHIIWGLVFGMFGDVKTNCNGAFMVINEKSFWQENCICKWEVKSNLHIEAGKIRSKLGFSRSSTYILKIFHL